MRNKKELLKILEDAETLKNEGKLYEAYDILKNNFEHDWTYKCEFSEFYSVEHLKNHVKRLHNKKGTQAVQKTLVNIKNINAPVFYCDCYTDIARNIREIDIEILIHDLGETIKEVYKDDTRLQYDDNDQLILEPTGYKLMSVIESARKTRHLQTAYIELYRAFKDLTTEHFFDILDYTKLDDYIEGKDYWDVCKIMVDVKDFEDTAYYVREDGTLRNITRDDVDDLALKLELYVMDNYRG